MTDGITIHIVKLGDIESGYPLRVIDDVGSWITLLFWLTLSSEALSSYL